jgi:von Willebrand factor type A C-terminal domain/von Willebrand factor type A domain
MSRFAAEVFENEYLPEGASEVHAVVTVTAGGNDPGVGDAAADGTGTVARAAEIVIIDSSGSMSERSKLEAARKATAAAVECIRDGVLFAVIAGSHEAVTVYPPDGGLAVASPQTRTDAAATASKLNAGGGTAIGTWLLQADQLFTRAPGRVCHAILLTDGNNEHETDEQLDAALEACEGRFQCDCRGVGTDWVVSELRRVASTLLGTVDIIPDPAAMADDFRQMMETAMGRQTGTVSLRVRTPQKARLAFVRQVAPTVQELTDRALEVDAQTSDYPTGAWGQESRDYHVCIEVEPQAVGAEMLAGRVSLVEDDTVLQQTNITAIWTDDQRLSTQINREVAHYTGQAELAECIQDGLQARERGDEASATFKLGRAVQLAQESGNSDTMRLLANVVEIDDAQTGTVRLRRDVADADEMALDTRSTKTVRVRPGP